METPDTLNQPKKRPVFLTVIGIISLINLGIAGLGVIFSFLSGPAKSDDVEQYMALNMKNVHLISEQGMPNLAHSMEKMVNFYPITNEAHYLVTTLTLLIVALGLIGVILMFQGKRLGFHLYIISCIVRICSFYIYAPASTVPTFLVMYFFFTSLLFIWMYSRNLKWMK